MALPFLYNFAAWTATSYDRVQQLRRYGEDMSVATTAYLERLTPAGAPAVALSSAAAERYGLALQAFLLKQDRAESIEPWQFWRTVHTPPPARPGLVVHRGNDDVGRARLTELGFRLLGGVAPFLLLWIAALFYAPVLAWTAWELARSGHAPAAAVFAAGCGCSPFLVESMALPYSAFGFYLIGLLAVTAFAVYTMLGTPSPSGFLLRTGALGLLLAICILCRDGTLLLIPGLLLAMIAGARRVGAARPGMGTRVMVLGTAVMALPSVLVRPPSHHELWTGVWMGLGDYDRTKGHVWSDAVAIKLLLDAGFDKDMPPDVEIFDRDIASPEKEAFFRSLVLRDVSSDPLWLLGILARRFVATVSQDELLVLGGRSDPSLRSHRGGGAPIPPNQGRIRFFYRLVTTADWIGFGRWRLALPVGALWATAAAFLLAAAWGAGPRASDAGARRERSVRPALGVAACAAFSVLPLPVLVTTAGALETEAFVVVYLLAFAFLAERAWRGGRDAWRGRRRRPGA